MQDESSYRSAMDSTGLLGRYTVDNTAQVQHVVEFGKAEMLVRRLKQFLYVDMSDKSIPWNIRIFNAHKLDVERALRLEKKQIEYRAMDLQRMEMELKNDELDLRSDELDFRHQQLNGRKPTSLISNTDVDLLSEEINRTVYLLDKLKSIKLDQVTASPTSDSSRNNQLNVGSIKQSQLASE